MPWRRRELSHITSVSSIELVGVSSPKDVLVILDVICQRGDGGGEMGGQLTALILRLSSPWRCWEQMIGLTEHLKVEVSRHSKDGLDVQLSESA